MSNDRHRRQQGTLEGVTRAVLTYLLMLIDVALFFNIGWQLTRA